jgi:hypothetical protein
MDRCIRIVRLPGLASDDAPVVAIMMATNLTQFRMVPERCMQVCAPPLELQHES